MYILSIYMGHSSSDVVQNKRLGINEFVHWI